MGALPFCEPKHILLVDDEAEILDFLESHFQSLGHQVDRASDGCEALKKLSKSTDLILLDIKMPGMDGFEVAQKVREHSQHFDVPILMTTALGDKENRLRAVEAGVNDFLAKPIDILELNIRSNSLLKMKEAQDAIKFHQLELEEKIKERTLSLREALGDVLEAQKKTREAHLETIHHLAVAAEYRDNDTGAHIRRVSEYCGLIADGLNLPLKKVDLIRHASPMHDIGKIVVPQRILMKEGKLEPEEWAIMKQHPTVGADILRGSSSDLLQTAEMIAISHHEKWDGSGYPLGLSGESIPIEGRICAIGDVFDALTSTRPYKEAYSPETAFAIIHDEQGTHFDPKLAGIFFQKRDEIIEIHRRYSLEPGVVKRTNSEDANKQNVGEN